MREVPLRDIARYAGRLIRASVADGSHLLITDRRKPLALLSPEGRPRPAPRYEWSEEGITEKAEERDLNEIPSDLPDDQRAVLEVLGEEGATATELCHLLGKKPGEMHLPLVRLEMKRLVKRCGPRWRRF